MKKYTLSQYNCIKKIGDTTVGVNLLKQLLFSIDCAKHQELMDYSDDLEQLQIKNSVFFNTMYKLGVIQDTHLDKTANQSLLLKNRMYIFNSEEYRLTINPTLNCNFNCWYCYETHSKKRMNKSIISNTLQYIQNLVEQKRMTVFYLDWFGGEPLLCYKTVMKTLAVEAKKICENSGILFESGITTNGYLINEEIITFFKEINMQSLQITLDGKREVHNTIRFQNNNHNSYDKIIQNIILLAERLEPKNLAVRINFTMDSFYDITSIIDSFPLSVRNKITILLQQVWQDKDKDKLDIKEFEEAKLTFEKAGFRVEKNILNCAGYTCYADKFKQAVINYDGRVFKCTARNFEKEKEDGVLTEDGQIMWHNDKLPIKIAKATFENDICMNCKYLPVCFAPCSQKMYQVHRGDDFNKYCFKAGIEITLDYIMTEFEKSGKALAPLLNYR
ncbi:radical SAM/SPASM domain-containing protein [Dysgonomonas sp. ZJ279]|uniref:radical SAM/SPASM domain-containing protein n=1 Tax=Dysgonomonas sp. ZJ279 TaxID=2709796 RepID=UPI0013EA7EE9|nr:radical SAM protein [Dysgonomonas sp. ZJ279]